jgi:hypothetical protein
MENKVVALALHPPLVKGQVEKLAVLVRRRRLDDPVRHFRDRQVQKRRIQMVHSEFRGIEECG